MIILCLTKEARGPKSEPPRELGDCLGESGQDSGKLPSLWSDMGRMSWLGANLDLFDWGRLREVPEPELGHLGTGDIDMAGLGEGYDSLM